MRGQHFSAKRENGTGIVVGGTGTVVIELSIHFALLRRQTISLEYVLQKHVFIKRYKKHSKNCQCLKILFSSNKKYCI